MSRPPPKESWERGQAEMRVSCRRNLMRLAERGNAAAAIFLGRTVLKMREPPREVHTEADVRSNTTVRFIAEWGRPEGEYLPPADGIELIEGEADEE